MAKHALRWALLAALAATSVACANGHKTAAAGDSTGSAAGKTRVYYIAADEVVWDYAPTGRNQMEGRPFNDVERTFMEPGKHVIGRTVMKALDREYTLSFTVTLKRYIPSGIEWSNEISFFSVRTPPDKYSSLISIF